MSSDLTLKTQFSTKMTDSNETEGVESPCLTDKFDSIISGSSMRLSVLTSATISPPLNSLDSSNRTSFVTSLDRTAKFKKTSSFRRTAPHIDVLIFGQPNSGKDVFVK